LVVAGYDPATSLQPLIDALVVPGTGINVNSGTSSYIGSSGQGGPFTGLSAGSGASALTLPDGVVLSSGLASHALPGTGTNKAWNTAGDSNLTTLAGMQSHDANSITLTFTTAPGTHSISFDFIYGSYDFTLDGFGAFLDGTSITFNGSGHAISQDPSFVRPNNYTSVIGFDETTVRLRTVAPLDPNVTTHTLKLVAADSGDDIVDSGVFLSDLRGIGSTVVTTTAAAPTSGIFQFDQATVTMDTTSPSVSITVDRVDGSSGAATIDYATSDGTALFGTDYTNTSGTLSFADGQSTATFNVPLLDNAIGASSSSFGLILSNPTGGALLGGVASSNVTIANNLSVVGFAAPQYAVAENQGSVTITVTRTGNLSATGSVGYSTSDGTAVDGTNYAGSSGVLVFSSGQSTATFDVPVTQDLKVDPTLTFALSLSNPVGNVRVAGRSAGTVSITDFTPPPTVSNLTVTPGTTGRNRASGAASALQMTFDQTLASTTAADFHLYRRFNDRAGGRGGSRALPIVVQSYDPGNNTLTLNSRRAMRPNGFYQLVATGNAAQGESGALLDGAGTGTEGSIYSYYFGNGKRLEYVDRDGNRVVLVLRGPGRMSLSRTADGQGQNLALTGVTAASVLSGSVHATRMGGSGVTTLATISGLGAAANALPAKMFVVV
jgi:hypothetical protein